MHKNNLRRKDEILTLYLGYSRGATLFFSDYRRADYRKLLPTPLYATSVCPFTEETGLPLAQKPPSPTMCRRT